MKNKLFAFFFCAMVLCGLAQGIVSCGSSSAVTQVATRSANTSLDVYFTDKQHGAAFRGNFYDSVDAWGAVDTAVTKYLVRDLDRIRSEDSVSAYSAGFYAAERPIFDAQFQEIYSIAKQ